MKRFAFFFSMVRRRGRGDNDATRPSWKYILIVRGRKATASDFSFIMLFYIQFILIQRLEYNMYNMDILQYTSYIYIYTYRGRVVVEETVTVVVSAIFFLFFHLGILFFSRSRASYMYIIQVPIYNMRERGRTDEKGIFDSLFARGLQRRYILVYISRVFAHNICCEAYGGRVVYI